MSDVFITCDKCKNILSENYGYKCKGCKRNYCDDCFGRFIRVKVIEGMGSFDDLECIYCTKSVEDRVFTHEEMLDYCLDQLGFSEGQLQEILREEMAKRDDVIHASCSSCSRECEKMEKEHTGLEDPSDCCFCDYLEKMKDEGTLFENPETDKADMCSKCQIKYDIRLEF